MRWLAAILVVALAACGKSKQAAPAKAADDAGVVADIPVDANAVVDGAGSQSVTANAVTWKDRPEPALRALGTALEDVPNVAQWLEERKLPRPDDVPPIETPLSIQAAVDALVAWDGAGGLAPIPCMKGMNSPLPLAILNTAKAAFELSNAPTDPPAHAALRLGVALMADDNDPMALLVGAALSKEAGESFTRRGITTPVPSTFLPAADLPWKVLAANARCVAWTLDTVDLADPESADLVEGFKQMGRKPEQALAEESAAVKAFWADTMKQAAAAKTRAELSALLERRIAEAHAMRPQSVLVPLLGSPYAAKSLLRDEERVR
jgi:hypothetical protein